MQNPEKSYSKYIKEMLLAVMVMHYLCFDDKFRKSFNPYLGEDIVYKFINSIIEESKCSNDVTKTIFTKTS